MSDVLSAEEDIATIGRREHYAMVYLKRDAGGDVETVILPVHGYGLWSTLYGFLALEGDGETHGRASASTSTRKRPASAARSTTRTGRALWPGKKLFDEDGEPAIEVVKGIAPPAARRRSIRSTALRRHADEPRRRATRALLARRERLRPVPRPTCNKELAEHGETERKVLFDPLSTTTRSRCRSSASARRWR